MLTFVSVVSGRPHLMKAAALHEGFRRNLPSDHVILDLKADWSHSVETSIQQVALDKLRWVKAPQPFENYLDHKAITFVAEQLSELKPDLVIVYGDLDGSTAGAIGAKTSGYPIVHIEAGLTISDVADSEEHNRLVLDAVADIYTTHLPSAANRLASLGVSRKKINLSVNPITALAELHAASLDSNRQIKQGFEEFGLATIHRKETLDDPEVLNRILIALEDLAKDSNIKLILYGGIKRAVDTIDWDPSRSNMQIVETLDFHCYLEMLLSSTFVLTDSSGVLDEALAFEKPSLVLRDETHRGHQSSDIIKIGGTTSSSIKKAWGELRSGPSQDPAISGSAVDQKNRALLGLAKLAEFVIDSATEFKLSRQPQLDIASHHLWGDLHQSEVSVILGEHVPQGNGSSVDLARSATGADNNANSGLVSEGITMGLINFDNFARTHLDVPSLRVTRGSQYRRKLDEAVVVFGSEAIHPTPRHLMSRLREEFELSYSLEWNAEASVVQLNLPNGQVLMPDAPGSRSEKDYALVVKASINNSPATDFILISGCHMWGTWAATKATTNPLWLAANSEAFENRSNNFAMVLSTRVVSGAYPLATQVLEVADLKPRLRSVDAIDLRDSAKAS